MEEAKEMKEVSDQTVRLRSLKHLLDKSEFYAKFVLERLQSQKNSTDKGGSAGESTVKKSKVTTDLLAKDMELLGDLSTMSPQGKEDMEKTPNPTGTRTTEAGLVVSVRQPVLLEGGVMRDYQLEGFEWLKLLYMNGVSGILADEMGLGKTIQAIALICFLLEKKLIGPFLIIGPLSTLANWVCELKKFAPKVPVVLYHGSKTERQDMWVDLVCKRTQVAGGNSRGVLPVVITSYEVAMKDRTPLQDLQWELIIVDEGHRIKNFNCKLVRELKTYKCSNKFLLTGTPLQNSLTELWSLLNYLMPEIFSDLAIFESWFEATDLTSSQVGDVAASSKHILQLEEKNNVVSTLHKILHPFMLRRVKADVELNIPPKKELLVFTPLSPAQEEMYRALLNNDIHQLLAPKDNVKQGAVDDDDDDLTPPAAKRSRRTCTLKEIDTPRSGTLQQSSSSSVTKNLRSETMKQGYLVNINACSATMDMRKVVNHPYLLRFPVHPGTKELVVNEDLVTSSGKMMVLDAMLAKLQQQGHKVLVFSQMCTMLDMIEEYLIMRNYKYCRLDGSLSVIDRQVNIRTFNTDPTKFVFLVSTRAGGLGINLTSADTVIIYDSDWNPQCDLQAQDRCHRIGQTKPVVVYRLTTDGTIDRYMVERATGKRRLEKLVIKKGRFHAGQSGEGNHTISTQELLELLNSKDYIKTITSNGYVYSDAELEQLLDRSDLQPGHVADKEKPSHSHLYEVFQPSASTLAKNC